MCSPSPVRTPIFQLTAEQPSTGECWILLEKDTPHPRAKEKPQQDSVRGKFLFIIKPHIHQRCLEGSNEILCAPGPRDTAETEPDLPLSVWVPPAEPWVSSGFPWGQGLLVQQTWVMQRVAQALLEEVTISPTIEPLTDLPTNCRTIIPRNSHIVKKVLGPTTDFPTWRSGKGTKNPQGIWLWRPMGFNYRISTGLGKQTLGGHKQKCPFVQASQEREERDSVPTRD